MSTSKFAFAALSVLVAALIAGVVNGSAQPTAAVGPASSGVVGQEGGLNIQLPGLKALADIADNQLRAFEAHGYDWITYQVQNEDTIRDFDLAPAKAVGLSAGVWGVSYDQSAFIRRWSRSRPAGHEAWSGARHHGRGDGCGSERRPLAA